MRNELRGSAVTRGPVSFAGLSLDRPRIMGVLNVTPDSFSETGDHLDVDAAIRRGQALAAAGCDILDIGGESTRPGAPSVELQAEQARVLPVIAALCGLGVPISIDTRNAATMRAAVAAGAAIVNDVSALSHDPAALGTVAELGVPVVLMHMQGNPQTMQQAPHYRDVVAEVCAYLEGRIEACEAAGIRRADIAIDCGIGFGKNLEHNLSLLRAQSRLRELGCAVLVGVSRKSFIGRLTGIDEPGDRLPGSLAAGLYALSQGAQILRVHDVAATVQAVQVWRALTILP